MNKFTTISLRIKSSFISQDFKIVFLFIALCFCNYSKGQTPDKKLYTINESIDCCQQWYETLVKNPYSILPDTALSLIDQSINALQKNRPKSNEALGKCLLVKANYISSMMDFKHSNDLAKEGVSVILESEDSIVDKTLLGWIYNLLGHNHEQLFDFDGTLRYSKKAEEVARRLMDWTSVANEYNVQTRAYTNVGDFEEAIYSCQQGLNILDTISGNNPTALGIKFTLINSLGLIYLQQGEKAVCMGRLGLGSDLDQKGLDLWKKLLKEGKDDPILQANVGLLYANIGSAYLKQSRIYPELKDSATYYLENSDLLFSKSPYYAESAYHGNVKLLLSNLLAKDYFEESMKHLETGLQMLGFYPTQTKEDRWRMLEKAQVQTRLIIGLINKASAYFVFSKKTKQTKDLEKSLALLKEAIQDIEYLSLNQLSSRAIVSQRNLLEATYLYGIDASTVLYEQTDDLAYLEESFSLIEKHKSFILRQGIRERYTVKSGATESQKTVLAQEAVFERNYQDLRYQWKKTQEAKSKDSLMNLILQGQESRLEFIENLKTSPDKSERALFFDRHDHSVPSLQTVKDKFLSKNRALITYSLGGYNPVVVVVLKNEQFVVRLTLDREFWKNFDFLNNCANNECRPKEYAASSFDVYQHVIKDIIEQLPSHVDELLIVPDNDLRGLSFEHLLTENSKLKQNSKLPFLLRKFAISYCYSVGTLEWVDQLKQLRSNDKQKTIAAFISSPEKGQTSIVGCSKMSLPYLSASTKKVMSFFPQEEATLFERASVSDFVKNCSNYNILHFTGHGCTEEDNPMDYFLQFMAEGNSNYDNGLTVKFIYDSLDINADLLVLASCNTKKGVLEGGEGLVSISRAFVQAGAAQMLVTLNTVNDYTSGEILLLFYEELKRSEKRPVLALAKAKRRYLDRNDIEDNFKSPNFWSNFVLIGGEY